MRLRAFNRAATLIIFLAVVAAPAAAQVTTSSIEGVVVDSSGAILPGVTVEIRSVDTNLTRTMVTDNGGRFAALQIPPGGYVVTLKLPGFATVVLDNVVATVGETVRLSPSMKVSGVAETVNVTTTSLAVDTSRTSAASTLDETTVRSTPILGRKFEDLLTLTPGVSIVQGPDGDEITFAGQRGVFNNISLDGGDYTNGFFGEQVGGQRAAIDITLEAVKEFQVIATGAGPEFGHTAGGVVNVITKSGTNTVGGSLFHFQRLEGLTSNTSDGKPLTDFHREQFGGTVGGPIVKNKAFYFVAIEGVRENLLRPNLSEPIGTACPVSAPTLGANEALINSNADCQRLALLNFFRTARGQEEGQPVKHTIDNNAFLTKFDWALTPSTNLSASYNFDYSKNDNQTFDVATYGTSANGTEGPSKINVANVNLFSTLSANKLNEFHLTFSREDRPRSATPSSVPADTAMGANPSFPTFRFGNPFFLAPNVDETVKRFQVKDNVTLVTGRHTVKAGGEWIHTRNTQIFRGFFEGRYIFDSVTGFLRYASAPAAGGFGPFAVGCSNGSYVTAPAACPAGTTTTGGPLLFYLQSSSPDGVARDIAGASDISNEEFALFIQDKWQPGRGLTVNYGLRWDGQAMPETVDPTKTAYASFLNEPRFPSDGTIPNQWNQFQPRAGFAWDMKEDGKSVVRANFGIYYARQNMLSQVGSVTTNGIQQKSDFRNTAFTAFADMPVWPNLLAPSAVPPGTFPAFTGVRVFDRDYRNPRVYSFNTGYDRELRPGMAAYVDFTVAKGTHLTRFLNYNVHGTAAAATQPATRDTTTYTGANPFEPALGDVFVTNSRGHGLYRGVTFGLRKRFSQHYQFEANYVLSDDKDDDSNERDPFTDRSFNFYDLSLDYGPSDRDIRHKVNVFTYAEMPHKVLLNLRIQGRTAQPITTSPRVLSGADRGRNWDRKDNAYFSLDWRLQRPFRVGSRTDIVPSLEMFNTFNNANNVNPLSTPALFNFDGFLRQGVGDPRQVQLAVKVTF
jgi:Carboxypeptidase regulatory-like domain